jgi:tRNA A-37 threonylcarbamoyl transferase component Bud32
MLSPGTIIDGRFEIVDFLGEGGMGTVYSARHKAMGRQIALKLLKSNLVAEDDKVQRFRNEARVLSGLDHPNIIAVHAIGIAETGQPYMAMDMVTGESLSEVIAKRGPFAQDEALQICIQICQGLQYAHQRHVIHRDIKPSNIILSHTAEHDSIAKIVDFGIAKILNSQLQQLTQTGAAIGSVFYLSPGQMEGRAADASSDIYSLGCTLYEMLAGVPPFSAESILETALMHKRSELVPVNERNSAANIDESVQTILDCMLQKEHHLRYHAAKDVEDDLQRALQKRTLKFAVKAHTKAVQAKRPQIALPILIALGAIIITSAIAYAVFKPDHSEGIKPDVETETRQALEAAARSEASAGRIPANVKPLLANARTITELADRSKNPVLRTRAWSMRARLQRDADNAPDNAFPMWRNAIAIANDALAGKNDERTRNRLCVERFEAMSEIVHARVSRAEKVSDADWTDELRYFAANKAVISQDNRRSLNSMTNGALEQAMGRGADEMLRVARVRVKTLNLLDTEPTEQTMEFANLPGLHIHSPQTIDEVKHLYGIK